MKPTPATPMAAPAQPAPPAQPRVVEIDAALPTLLGLLVVWAGLIMVFAAQYLSESRVEVRLPGVDSEHQVQALARALEPQAKLLLPLSVHYRGISRADALVNLGDSVGFTVNRPMLNRAGLSTAPTTIKFDSLPLYQALHKLLDNPGLGIALDESNLIVFPQTINTNSTQDRGTLVDWKANLRLSRHSLLIVPSAQSDTWFSVHLVAREATPGPEDLNVVQVEVWKGTEWLTMAKAALDEAGRAQLSLSTSDKTAFEIQRRERATADQYGLYSLGFYYQSFH